MIITNDDDSKELGLSQALTLAALDLGNLFKKLVIAKKIDLTNESNVRLIFDMAEEFYSNKLVKELITLTDPKLLKKIIEKRLSMAIEWVDIKCIKFILENNLCSPTEEHARQAKVEGNSEIISLIHKYKQK